MQRLKDKELDLSKPHFSDVQLTSSYPKKEANEISMTKPDVVRKIRAEGLESLRFHLALQGGAILLAMTSVSDTCLPNVRSRHNRLQVSVFFNLQHIARCPPIL